ncbi:MAG: chitobiase/beta-hexosaminidase C-terminal domain-containing protein [Candidatus Acidiferrum sp.]
MPELASGKFPPLLSQTGAFENVRTLTPNPNLIPYEPIVPFWSDGAIKTRWISLPKGTIRFSPKGEWKFPNGTVFIKEFDLPTDETNPAVRRRLETRFIVRDSQGGVYGVVYKWRPDDSDADLLTTSLMENITIKNASGTQTQTWYYPSRKDCLTCHTSNAGGVLGVKSRQLNREMTYPSGVTDNELRAWNHIGLFDPPIQESQLAAFPKLAKANDKTRSLEDRARSFLDVNCSQCHRPGGTVAMFDARYYTPLAKQGLIDGPVLLDEGIDRPRIIAPNDIWRSILFMRVNTTDTFKMPPLARMTIDSASVELLRDWIHSLPGPPVLDPPLISPPGGNFKKEITVTLADAEPSATIHYTLDGSEPTTSDPVYQAPLHLTKPKVVRARAFKQGFTRSITAQQIYIPAS